MVIRYEVPGMKYAVLADIHSNLTALQAVLLDIERRGGVDEMWCLGDIVGYGPDPNQCIEIIQRQCSICLAGNHDWAAIAKLELTNFNPEAAEAARWTSRQLQPEGIQYLEGLPLTKQNGDFTLVHGSPRDPIWEYVLSATQAQENIEFFKTPYCMIGHSHIPSLFECGKSCSARRLTAGTVIELADKRLIINAGSVGQPRDGDPRASYAVYDNEPGEITLHRVRYDILSTQERMQKAGLPRRLILRLSYGQ
jgi:predicted phosphodiesterase